MPQFMYVPLENGDPIVTTFGGREWRAHEPVEITPDMKIEQLRREQVGQSSDGEPRYKGVERMVPLIDMLRGNSYFQEVGKEAPASAPVAAKRPPGRPRVPKTPSEYRSHAQAWFQTVTSHTELAKRWDAEKPLREKLGIHDEGEDCSYLRPFFDARFHALKKAA